MSALSHPLLQRMLAAGLGLVFIYASHDKIWKREVAAAAAAGAPGTAGVGAPATLTTGPEAFARIVYRYQVVGPDATLPPIAANLVAVTLPWIELVAGVLLVLGVWRREAALVVGLLLLTFVAAVGSTLLRGIDVENCGCFSLAAEGRRAGWGLIFGDLGLLAGAAVLAFVRPRPAPASALPPDAAEVAQVAGDPALTAPPPDA